MRHDPPQWMYGTAWKEEETARLTRLAIRAGFRAIDTANQRKHYFEAAVGKAIVQAVGEGEIDRGALFLQTKFTHRGGQDHRLPYDPKAPLALQVPQSFASSLEHLGTTYIDSYVLHGPSQRVGLAPEDWAAWRAMEEIQSSGKARVLGISNVNEGQLRELWDGASVRPAFVQNRCYASRGWDREVRRLCAEHGIGYQGFSLLTANREVLAHATVRGLAKRLGKTPEQVVFRFAMQVGMIPLTGTKSASHMAEDLAASTFTLATGEVQAIESLVG
jgi:diketogulonate reductase-like aldo/keto reductase